MFPNLMSVSETCRYPAMIGLASMRSNVSVFGLRVLLPGLVLGFNSILASAQANADNPGMPSSFSIRGFGTLGVARSSSDQAEFVRDLSQPRGIKGGNWSARIDSVLGAQVNWQATPEIELVGQVVSRYHYDESRTPEVMWAFAKWEPDARIALRAGRIGADFMMLADSRLIGYSYLAARPSADFFGPLFFSHFDGADASLTVRMGNGLVRGKLFAGKTQEKASDISGIWDTSGSPVRGVTLEYVNGPWQFRTNAAHIRFSNDFPLATLPDLLRTFGAINAADALTTGGTVSRFYSAGVAYDAGPIRVQGMLNKIRHGSGLFQNSHGGYLLAGYRMGVLTPYAGVAWWKSTSKSLSTGLPDIPFATLNQTFDSVVAASAADQTTYTLGTRWDVRPNVAFKLQWDAVRGSSRSVFPVRAEQPGWNGRTDVISAVVDFVF